MLARHLASNHGGLSRFLWRKLSGQSYNVRWLDLTIEGIDIGLYIVGAVYPDCD